MNVKPLNDLKPGTKFHAVGSQQISTVVDSRFMNHCKLRKQYTMDGPPGKFAKMVYTVYKPYVNLHQDYMFHGRRNEKVELC